LNKKNQHLSAAILKKVAHIMGRKGAQELNYGE
jgi:hypothetical protein